MNQLTIHIINELPWSNLNRDDTGIPKRLTQGGVLRAQLSSQSIKRAIRKDYESKSLDISIRSGNLSLEAARRAREINPLLDEKSALKAANLIIGKLTKASAGGDDGSGDKNRSIWLSAEELEAAAQRVVEQSEASPVSESRTGSLAISAFGRMFANQQESNTDAAISVSPAVTTHPADIETDYFSTSEDRPTKTQGAGAAYLGVASYTNGVFYRTITIDRGELRRTWTGFSAPDAEKNLSQFITSVIYALPTGKSHGTAPYTPPALVLAEEQLYRIAYSFETPVSPVSDGRNCGYLMPTVEALRSARQAALAFDPDNFGRSALAGVSGSLSQFGLPTTNKNGFVKFVTEWIVEHA